jgi:hypothetical protein
LYRGYVLTDFEGNEVAIKNGEEAIKEIKKLLNLDEKSENPISEVFTPKKSNYVEIHRNIFEKAKEQINLTGKVNGAKISRELEINASTVHAHLKKMNFELEELIKNWQVKNMKSTDAKDIRKDKNNIDDKKSNEDIVEQCQ